ncbi:hypothetical protein QM298_10625 [Pseudomonas mendocina]|nr:hypothetical protein [Pseudomonas mendocina]MDV5861362.1 hypothetical protein [Pseudomonas mendocina]
MSEKHTPGPWIAREVSGAGWPGQRGFAIDFNADQEQVVDFVYEEADAKLIAAAPDLLDALESLSRTAPRACCADFHHIPSDYHGEDESCPALDRYEAACLSARAAIAKARGAS